MPISIDVVGTIAGLDAMAARIEAATDELVGNALHMFQAAAMAAAPVGDPDNSTNAPGDLRRSIDVEGPHGADGIYAGEVGPTVIYGRQRELGGDIYPVRAKALVFSRFGVTVFTRHVFQVGSHYMERAYNETIPGVKTMVDEKIAVALVGAQ